MNIDHQEYNIEGAKSNSRNLNTITGAFTVPHSQKYVILINCEFIQFYIYIPLYSLLYIYITFCNIFPLYSI